MSKDRTTGTAIAIAWPDTLCKQPGSWYDPLAKWMGINKGYFYKVGHAAVVLIDHQQKKAHYFDFGRYHAPFQHGRVRSAVTDHELKINTPVALDEKNKISNIHEILTELNDNQGCHGDGPLHAGITSVNFKKGIEKAVEMQQKSPLLYGPFVRKGTNCSRFVNSVLTTGVPSLWRKFLLKISASPTPLWNVKVLNEQLVLPQKERKEHNPARKNVLIHG